MQADPKRKPHAFRALWTESADLEPVFADQMHIVAMEDRVFLTFGQTRPPMLEPTGEDVTTAPIKPVFRIVLSRPGVKALIQLLNRHTDVDEGERKK